MLLVIYDEGGNGMRVSALLALTLLSAGCAPSKYQVQMQSFQQQKLDCINSLPPEVEKLEKDAVVRMEDRIGCVPVERGVHGGLEYMIDHSSGRAEFAESPAHRAWVLKCEKDAVTDKVSAQIIKGNLMVFRAADWESVGLIEQTYPGSDQTVRVDDNPALVAASGDTPNLRNGKVIVEQLKTGRKFLTRYLDWPYGVNRDASYDAFGFNVVYDYSKRCVP